MTIDEVYPPFKLSGFFNFAAVGLLLIGLPLSGVAQGRKPVSIVHETDIAGTPCLSLEDITEALGAKLNVTREPARAEMTFRSHTIEFPIGSEDAQVDGKTEGVGGTVTQDQRAVWVPRHFFTSGSLAAEFRKRIDLGPADPLPETTPKAPELEKTATLEPPRAAIPATPIVSVAVPESKATEPVPAAPVHAIRRILVDAGHGGKDPGALGTRGTMEKTINLWMARELAEELRAKDFEVLLTRTDDTFIPLGDRTALANKYKADLFISLHCNASLTPSLNGFEIYFLSENASNPHAEAVARLENAALELEGKKPSSAVQSVLQSLAKNAMLNRSAQLGALINREVTGQLSQVDLGVKQAAFYVLRGAQMPAVLVELGFLTNRKEERLLLNESYRRKLSGAIAKSILEYDRKQQAEQKK